MTTVRQKIVPAAPTGPERLQRGLEVSRVALSRRPAISPLSERQWQLASAIILLIAVCFRFYHLSLVPLHSDEGVNGSFLARLFQGGGYQYDPTNYHGPTLYYSALALTTVNAFICGKAGLSTVAIRSVPAICGTGLVWLSLQLRRYLGTYSALVAAMFVAISPGAVYFSRYFIHEIPFVLFTLSLVVAAMRYHDTARPSYLMIASASGALLVATKETAVISIVVLVLALLCTTGYTAAKRSWNRDREDEDESKFYRSALKSLPVYEMSRPNLIVRAGGWPKLFGWSLVALALFIVIHILCYSSFGSNFPKGVYDSVATFRYWAKTGVTEHLHDCFTYLRWLGEEELPLLLLGALGFALAIDRGSNRFALFCGFWAAGMLVSYSLIGYKTPWLTLNISIPLALAAGYGTVEMCARIRQIGRQRVRVLLLLVLGLAPIICAYQAIDISFFRYDDESVAYVYAHTQRQLFSLLSKLNEIALREGTGTQTAITITAGDYWPLPWYLRDYSNVAYWGKVTPDLDRIVIGEESEDSELQKVLGGKYDRVDSYDLRPGVVLVLYVRRGLVPDEVLVRGRLK